MTVMVPRENWTDQLEPKLDRLNWGLLAFALGIIGNHAF
jgi:hypothetical protein